MNRFFTVTDADTQYTNSRSKRYQCLGDAIREAQQRIEIRNPRGGVVIMEAIKVVRKQHQPVVVEDIHS